MFCSFSQLMVKKGNILFPSYFSETETPLLLTVKYCEWLLDVLSCGRLLQVCHISGCLQVISVCFWWDVSSMSSTCLLSLLLHCPTCHSWLCSEEAVSQDGMALSLTVNRFVKVSVIGNASFLCLCLRCGEEQPPAPLCRQFLLRWVSTTLSHIQVISELIFISPPHVCWQARDMKAFYQDASSYLQGLPELF